jgi:hypothetical protein
MLSEPLLRKMPQKHSAWVRGSKALERFKEDCDAVLNWGIQVTAALGHHRGRSNCERELGVKG